MSSILHTISSRASLVATPNTARYQDALAFTRSLGDLHLQTYGSVTIFFDFYLSPRHVIFSFLFPVISFFSFFFFDEGVSHLPEVHMIDLDKIFKSHTKESEPLMLCLVMASDGVWDNWLYEDVNKFVMDPSCLKAVNGSCDGANRVGKSFMARNTLFSKRNFGSQADNATGIVLYMSEFDPLQV